MRPNLGLLVFVAIAGCADEESVIESVICHFPSGRPCPLGVACLGEQGNECNYSFCTEDGQLLDGGVGCTTGNVAITGGGPYDCDPASLRVYSTPPPAPCPLGGLWTVENGGFGMCVPVAECRALACDPQYGGDGCPSNHRCDAATNTCVAS
jgi:hypothetical protein